MQCPYCGSQRLYKDGLRYLADGTSVQRWLCRNCGYRFTDPNHRRHSEWKNPPFNLNLQNCLDHNCQGNNDPEWRDSTSLGRLVQTLATVEKENEKRDAGATTTNKADIKGKIVEYCFYMQKRGYAESTIRLHRNALKTLAERGANLMDPESVKEVIARQKWSENRRRNVINAYDRFAKYVGLTWGEAILQSEDSKIPFIPTEAELDALIAGTGRKLSAFLQLLKETAMRCGEAKRLKWTDIDFEKGIIRLNEPEKGSNPRLWKVSQKLIAMLNALP